jgi:hypothetical protein
MSTRKEVYVAIDSERTYQNQLKRNGAETNLMKGVDRYWTMDLNTIAKICRDLQDYSYNNAGTPPMDFFRKIAAVAVHSMEIYGAPLRELPKAPERPWSRSLTWRDMASALEKEKPSIAERFSLAELMGIVIFLNAAAVTPTPEAEGEATATAPEQPTPKQSDLERARTFVDTTGYHWWRGDQKLFNEMAKAVAAEFQRVREEMKEQGAPKFSADLLERTAQLSAHRACCGTEHDPANGKLHGYCVVCGVPWPCEVAALRSEGQEGK